MDKSMLPTYNMARRPPFMDVRMRVLGDNYIPEPLLILIVFARIILQFVKAFKVK